MTMGNDFMVRVFPNIPKRRFAVIYCQIMWGENKIGILLRPMKRCGLFLFFISLSVGLWAQQPFNGSFERWSSPTNPDGWGTWATVASANPVVSDSMIRFARKDSLNVPGIYSSDTSSVRLAVDTITLPSQGQVTLAGFVCLGGATNAAYPDTPVGLRFGFYPYRKYPDSLILDYKYSPAGIDTALVVMTMIRFDSASQHEVKYLNNSWTIAASSGWAHMSIPLFNYYQNLDTFLPDSIQLYVLSSISANPQIGTTLWLDSVHFDASVNIIIDTFPLGISPVNKGKVSIYPNPADTHFDLLLPESESGCSVQLYDAEGRQVYTGKAERTLSAIDTRSLPDGNYVLKVHSTDHLTVYSGHVSVIH
jgi:Secretion system C-terminal sorting domain